MPMGMGGGPDSSGLGGLGADAFGGGGSDSGFSFDPDNPAHVEAMEKAREITQAWSGRLGQMGIQSTTQQDKDIAMAQAVRGMIDSIGAAEAQAATDRDVGYAAGKRDAIDAMSGILGWGKDYDDLGTAPYSGSPSTGNFNPRGMSTSSTTTTPTITTSPQSSFNPNFNPNFNPRNMSKKDSEFSGIPGISVSLMGTPFANPFSATEPPSSTAIGAAMKAAGLNYRGVSELSQKGQDRAGQLGMKDLFVKSNKERAHENQQKVKSYAIEYQNRIEQIEKDMKELLDKGLKNLFIPEYRDLIDRRQNLIDHPNYNYVAYNNPKMKGLQMAAGLAVPGVSLGPIAQSKAIDLGFIDDTPISEIENTPRGRRGGGEGYYISDYDPEGRRVYQGPTLY